MVHEIKSPSKQPNVCAIPRQLGAKQRKRPHPSIRGQPKARQPPELNGGDVQIAVGSGEQSIGPCETRVADENARQASRGVEAVDGVLFEIARVHKAVGVGVQAVGGAFLAEGADGRLGLDLGVRGIIAQAGRGDAV